MSNVKKDMSPDKAPGDKVSSLYPNPLQENGMQGGGAPRPRTFLSGVHYNMSRDHEDFYAFNARLAHKKVQAIQNTGFVEKKGKNDRFGYEYAREADYLNTVRSALASAGIAFTYSVVGEEMIKHSETRGGSTRFRNRQKIQFTLTDAETGFSESTTLVTYGIDTEDKGVWKGITGAVKYFVAKTFLIPTGDDPENDGGVAYLSDEQRERLMGHASDYGISRTQLDFMLENILGIDPDHGIPKTRVPQITTLIKTANRIAQRASEEANEEEANEEGASESEDVQELPDQSGTVEQIGS